jgi:hypothetical protein
MTEPVKDYLTFNFENYDTDDQYVYKAYLNQSMFSSYKFGKNIKLKVLQFYVFHSEDGTMNPCHLFLKNVNIRNAYCNDSPDVFVASEFFEKTPEYRLGALPQFFEFDVKDYEDTLPTTRLKCTICVELSYYDEPVIYHDKYFKRID